MEEGAFKNLYDDLELKKQDDDTWSVNTEVPSDPWFDEEDIMASTPKEQVQEDEAEKDISYSCLYGKETEETKLLVEEIDLYGDLVRIEEEEMKAKKNREIELENCKKELRKLRESDAQKSAKIEELSKKNEALTRSMCSLYKTAQNEITRKDELLAEANRQTIKLENILFRKNEWNARQSQCTRCQNCNHENGKDNNTSKRKRSKSPEPYINAKERCFSSRRADADTRVSSSGKERKSNFLDPVSRGNNSESKNEVSSKSRGSRSPKSSKTERDSSVSKSRNEKISSDKLSKCNTDNHISRMDSGNNKETSKSNISSSPISLCGTKGNNSESKNEVSSKSHVSRPPKSSNNKKESDSSVSKSSNDQTSSDKLNKCNTDNHISRIDSGNNKEMAKSNTSSSPISLCGTKGNNSESKNEVSAKSHGSGSPKSSNNNEGRDSSVSKSSDEKTSTDKLNKCNTDSHISRMDSGNNKEIAKSNTSSSPISLSGTKENNSESKNEVSSKSHVSRSPKSSNNEKERDSSVSKSNNEKTSSDKLSKCNTDNHISRIDSGNNKETLSESNISPSPLSLSGTKEKDISKPEANDSIILPSNKDHPASTSSCPILEERKDQLTKDNECVLYQPPQTFNFSENSRDSTETNNIFFNMLPDSLKKSFYEYEQSQIISLNKLKQSFINEYFNSDATIPSTSDQCSLKTSEMQGIHLKQLLFDKKSHVSTSSLLTPSSEGHSSTNVTDKFQKKESERNSRDFKEVRSRGKSVKTREVCKITRSDRKNLETLYRYRNERISFSDRRKFGYRNNRKYVHKNL